MVEDWLQCIRHSKSVRNKVRFIVGCDTNHDEGLAIDVDGLTDDLRVAHIVIPPGMLAEDRDLYGRSRFALIRHEESSEQRAIDAINLKVIARNE